MDCQWNAELAKKGIMQCDVCGWRYPKKYEKDPQQLHRNCSKAKQLPPRTDEEIRILEKICDDCPHHAALEDRCQSPLCCGNCASQKGLQLAKVRPNAAWTCKENKWPAYERRESGLILPDRKPILAGTDLTIPKPFGGMLPLAVKEMGRRRCCTTIPLSDCGMCNIPQSFTVSLESMVSGECPYGDGDPSECDPEGTCVNCDISGSFVVDYYSYTSGQCLWVYLDNPPATATNDYTECDAYLTKDWLNRWRWFVAVMSNRYICTEQNPPNYLVRCYAGRNYTTGYYTSTTCPDELTSGDIIATDSVSGTNVTIQL